MPGERLLVKVILRQLEDLEILFERCMFSKKDGLKVETFECLNTTVKLLVFLSTLKYFSTIIFMYSYGHSLTYGY